MIDLRDLFLPCINLLQEWLTIDVTMFGFSFKLWGVFAFLLMLGIFVQLVRTITGVDFGGDDNIVGHSFHIGGFGD